MRIVRGLESYPPDAGESAVALGVFDGIHLGHRAILTTAVGEARLLGRPYSVEGEVVRGAGRGRTLGFPTANVKPDHPLALPAGVYVCQALVGSERYDAVLNLGVRPTFGETELLVEAHLLDFSGDLYGRRLRLEFLRRLREERKFPDIEALRRQIALDVAAARQGG